MPCSGFNIPALKYCPSAVMLLKDSPEDSICNECYARKGFYIFKNVSEALQGRADFVILSLRENDGDRFVEEISKQIKLKYFDKHGNILMHGKGFAKTFLQLDFGFPLGNTCASLKWKH